MRDPKRIKRLLIPLVIVYFAPRLFFSDFSQQFETGLIDAWYSYRPSQPVPQSVTVVRVDPRSLRRLGLTPKHSIGFANLAEAIERIAAAGPKLIVLDIYFSALSSSDEVNERLMRALSSTPTVIARGIVPHIDTDLAGGQHLDLERTIPPPMFTSSAKRVLPMMVRTDRDGVVRKINLSTSISPIPLERTPLLESLREHVSPDVEQPGDDDLINYYGPPYAIPDVPIYKLLLPDETVPAEYFQNRVVFIGGVDTRNDNPDGGDDSFDTPMSHARMYGVEIHATIAQNLLDQSWIRRGNLQLEAVVQTLILGAFGMLLVDAGLTASLLVAATLFFAWAAVSCLCFSFLCFFVPGATLFGLVFPGLLAGAALAKKISSAH